MHFLGNAHLKSVNLRYQNPHCEKFKGFLPDFGKFIEAVWSEALIDAEQYSHPSDNVGDLSTFMVPRGARG